MKQIIDYLFLVKEIKSKEGVLHFKRWRILSTPWFNIYIHGIYKADEEKHLHDHPWDYISICLKGTFQEESKTSYRLKNIFPGDIIKKKAEEFHKIKSIGGTRAVGGKPYSLPVITLFITGKKRRIWGYDVDGTWVDFKTYRKTKHEHKIY